MPTCLQIVKKFYPHVTKVVDAKRPIQLHVTKRDVLTSRRGEHASCALAECAVRTLQVEGAVVSTRTAYLITGKVATRFSVPERASREIVSFDRGAHFYPGDYKLMPAKKHAPRGSKTRHNGDTAAGKLSHRTYNYTEGVRETLSSRK